MSERENASFLKLIGLAEDQDSLRDENTQEDSEAFSQDYSTQAEAIVDSEITEAEQEVWAQTDFSVREVFEEMKAPADLSNRTAIYSQTEFEHVLDRPIRKEYEEADRLLDGIEDAEASRATDIFAKSYRIDSRNTMTPTEKDLDPFDNFDEESFVEAITDEPSELYSELGELAEDIKIENSEATVEDSQQHFEDPGFDENEQSQKTAALSEDYAQAFTAETTSGPELSDAKRKTVSFHYQDEVSEPIDQDAAKIVLLDGEANRHEIFLNHFPLKLGRDLTNHVVVNDSNVSRFHCEIRNEPQGLRFVDLGSTNGIKVNGEIVTDKFLNSHDVIQVGEAIFEFLPPGETAKGLSQISAAHETQLFTEIRPNRSIWRKVLQKVPQLRSLEKLNKQALIRIAAVLVMIGAGLFMFFKDNLSQASKEVATQALVSSVQSDFDKFRSEVELALDSPISEVNADKLKELFLQKIKTEAKYKVLPQSVLQELNNAPPVFIKLLVEDPSLVESLVEAQKDEAILWNQIRLKLQEAQSAGDAGRVQRYAQVLAFKYPEDPQIKSILSASSKNEATYVQLEKEDETNLPEDQEQKFNDFMISFQERVDKMIDENKYQQALDFSKLVRERVMAVVKTKPAVQPLAEGALAEWTSKIRFLEKKLEESQEMSQKVDTKIIQGDQLIAEIRGYMDAGRVNEASLTIERFFREFPDHPDQALVQRLREEIDSTVSMMFDQLKTQIEALIESQTYSSAWEKIYKFLDRIPKYPPALKLKEEIDSKTKLQASKFYQRARLFEYETNDLVAAEQFYKKSLETADPKGDLIEKASRRLKEVQQKMMK